MEKFIIIFNVLITYKIKELLIHNSKNFLEKIINTKKNIIYILLTIFHIMEKLTSVETFNGTNFK